MAKKLMVKGETATASTTGSLELPTFLCFSIYSTNHAFNRIYQPLLKRLKLTYLQFITMILLWERDEQLVGELGQKLFLQSNTLTPMLKRLEAVGYVRRSRDSSDERQVVVSLTNSGRKLRLQAASIVRSVRDATQLKNEQFDLLKAQVDALRLALEGQIDS